jgi:hypothetical protein
MGVCDCVAVKGLAAVLLDEGRILQKRGRGD